MAESSREKVRSRFAIGLLRDYMKSKVESREAIKRSLRRLTTCYKTSNKLKKPLTGMLPGKGLE